MATRALFIGLGGTGGVSLSFTRSRLAARLRSAGWTDGFPEQAWSFVHIDVPASSDIGPRLDSAESGNALALGAKRFSGSEYQNLVTSGIRYDDLDRQALSRTKTEALVGWRHRDPRQVMVPIERGAGQYRSVGALVALATRERIAQALRGAHSQLLSDRSLTEAHRITERLGGSPDLPSDPPQVFIVTSMIGGAGAGMVLEVASIARSLFGDWVSAFLVAPEGFNLDVVGRSAPANAWALVSELQYLVSAGDHDHVPVANERLTTPATARGLFVLGRANQNIQLSGDAAVEKVIGETLASVVTRDSVLIDLVNFSITNSVTQTDNLDLGESGSFRSMGFGRLELGRDRFGRYATDRLTGLVGERLSSLHVPRRKSEDGTEERHVDAVENIASLLRYSVAEQAGLHELDDEIGPHDQILNALAPRPFESWSVGRLMEKLTPGDVKIADLIHQLREWGRGRERNDRLVWREQLSENIESWTRSVEKGLFEATVQVIAKHGLPVATATLKLIREDLDTARGQLQRDARTKASVKLTPQFGEVVPASGEGIATKDQRSKLAQITSRHLSTKFDALAYEAAADACAQVSENLVAPLLQALEATTRRVRDTQGDWVHQLRLLPVDGGVQAYRPDSYEVVIEKVETFDQQFGEQISATMAETRRDAAIDAAVTELLVEFAERWISIEAGWRPGTIGGLESVPELLAVSLRVEPAEIMDVVQAWMNRPDSPLRKHLEAGLASFVSQGPKEAEEFMTALSTLIDVAGPLGRCDEGNVMQIHEGRSSKWAFSEFPFQKVGKEVRDAICDVVDSAEALSSQEHVKWVADDRDSIELVSYEGPYQAICFETIMSPIRTIWEDAVQVLKGERFDPTRNGVMSKFGSMRHTFPMSMTGPLSLTGQLELVRGYLLALATGRFKDWSVKSEELGTFLPLPEHAYPIDQVDHRSYASTLGELLEDVKVAYLEASGDDLDSLRPYQTLVRIGRAYEVEVGKIKDSPDQRERLEELIGRVTQSVDQANEPSLPKRERSSDLYELGELLVKAVGDLSEALSSSAEATGF